jgi:hypothetical protein
LKQVGCQILLRIFGRYLEINDFSIGQINNYLNGSFDNYNSFPLASKIERIKEEWNVKTNLAFEAVLDAYHSRIILLTWQHERECKTNP